MPSLKDRQEGYSANVGHGTTKPMNGLQHSNAPCCVTDDSRPATTRLRVLLVEDNPADVELVLVALRKDGFDVSSDVVQTVEEFTLRIQANGFDVILADYNLPQWRGMEALEILRCENLDVPLIVVTGYLGRGEGGGVHQARRHRLCFERPPDPAAGIGTQGLGGKAAPRTPPPV